MEDEVTDDEKRRKVPGDIRDCERAVGIGSRGLGVEGRKEGIFKV